jgi:hypothetical protein
MPTEEHDLAFVDFATDPAVAERRYPSLDSDEDTVNENAPGVSDRGRFAKLEHETRFELATLTLARRCSG